MLARPETVPSCPPGAHSDPCFHLGFGLLTPDLCSLGHPPFYPSPNQGRAADGEGPESRGLGDPALPLQEGEENQTVRWIPKQAGEEKPSPVGVGCYLSTPGQVPPSAFPTTDLRGLRMAELRVVVEGGAQVSPIRAPSPWAGCWVLIPRSRFVEQLTAKL